MELPSVGSGAEFALRGPHATSKENVTLLSYQPKNNKNNNYIHRFVQNQATNNYVVSSCAQTNKKFNFGQKFRKRSKSASRLDERKRSNSICNLTSIEKSQENQENQISDQSRDSSQNRNQEKSTPVELVGFSTCNSEFSHAGITGPVENTPNQRFQTLKTSREVKMERERLRQEKLHRLTQETKDLFNRMKTDPRSSPMTMTSHERFFDESRLLSNRLNNAEDPFGQFVREHQERFAALTASIMGPTENSSASSQASEVIGKQSSASTAFSNNNSENLEHESNREQPLALQPPSAADLVASILNGSELSKKHIRKSSSSSKISSSDNTSSSKVRTIEIKRESQRELQRSNSGSSDTSSGFGSLNTTESSSQQVQNLSKEADLIKQKLDSNPVQTKLQLLQERQRGNRILSTNDHHPSFANHFGFRYRADPFFVRNNRRIMNNYKVQVTKSKSSDSQTYRYSTEELTLESYGDSETESDDEDVDLENLDSVSIVAARASSSSSASSNGSTTVRVIRAHGASPSLDSGRGDSPESSCNSTLVLTPPTNAQTHLSPKKPPRPISAVPSEYSDISTSSCRTSDDGESDEKSVVKTEESTEPVRISIVVKKENSEESEDPHALAMSRVFRVASELLSTEEQYVTVLYLIDQIFHFRVDQENRVSNMFPAEVLPQMFANIKSIYKFHAEFLLPQLRDRMALWHSSKEESSNQRIGDIIVKFSPFFKMYTEYVKNFDNAIHTINTTYAKNAKFAAIMDDIHAMPECGNLSLQHHMLTPIQRIPRYEILLKEYLKKLPEDSPDRADSEKALHLVSTAAKHANDAMKRIEKFKKLLEVQESLGGTVDLVSPTRELLKEGKIVKISARSGDHQDRYLFLFSDLLLLCSARLITNRVISGGGPAYRLRAKFQVDNMQILEGDNLVTANTFYIRDDHKSVELYTQTRREKEDWLESLFEAIKELYQRKSSLRIGREILRPMDSEIGKKQPHLLKLEAIHKCMECSQPFSMMRKKYNCRACGIVACAKCTGQKQILSFEDKACRVCKSCHEVIKSRLESEKSENQENHTHQIISKDTLDVQVRPKGLLEVPANSQSILSGYLHLKSGVSGGGGSKPVKRWFALLPDFVLYSFKSNEASEALTATPIPGLTVMGGADWKGDAMVSDKDKTLKLCYSSVTVPSNNNSQVPLAARKTYYLMANTKEDIERWIKVLRLASRAELPSLDETEELQE